MRIRPFRADDIEWMTIWLNKNHIRNFFGNPDEWINEINENIGSDWIHYYIVETSHPVGFVQYYETDKAPQGDWTSEPAGTVGIDYLIGDEGLLGKGHGREIIGLLIDEIKSRKKYNYVIADPVAENMASVKVLEQCGFSLRENGLYRLEL